MSIARLVVQDVRCIARAELALGDNRNFLIGPNGAGKTSCLEAVHLLGRGRSFRTRHVRRLVRHGADGLSVFGEVSEGAEAVGTSLQRLGVALQSGKLTARLDGGSPDSLAELARTFPVHIIDPKLHYLIEAGPSERRRFLDAGVFHVEHSYLSHWREYRRALGQRNAALKRREAATLAAWTAPLLESGAIVDQLRRDYSMGLAAAVSAVGKRLLGCDVRVEYVPGWRAGLSFEEALTRNGERDRLTGTTQAGPHRADLELHFDAGLVRDIASRGQQKLVAAALVLGQVAEMQRLTGRRGTLLVDDPAAELDDDALRRLLLEISALESQSLITGLQLDVLGATPADPVFHVEQGSVKPMVY